MCAYVRHDARVHLNTRLIHTTLPTCALKFRPSEKKNLYPDIIFSDRYTLRYFV